MDELNRWEEEQTRKDMEQIDLLIATKDQTLYRLHLQNMLDGVKGLKSALMHSELSYYTSALQRIRSADALMTRVRGFFTADELQRTQIKFGDEDIDLDTLLDFRNPGLEEPLKAERVAASFEWHHTILNTVYLAHISNELEAYVSQYIYEWLQHLVLADSEHAERILIKLDTEKKLREALGAYAKKGSEPDLVEQVVGLLTNAQRGWKAANLYKALRILLDITPIEAQIATVEKYRELRNAISHDGATGFYRPVRRAPEREHHQFLERISEHEFGEFRAATEEIMRYLDEQLIEQLPYAATHNFYDQEVRGLTVMHTIEEANKAMISEIVNAGREEQSLAVLEFLREIGEFMPIVAVAQREQRED